MPSVAKELSEDEDDRDSEFVDSNDGMSGGAVGYKVDREVVGVDESLDVLDSGRAKDRPRGEEALSL